MLKDYKARRAQWIADTGLQQSSASLRTALGLKDKYIIPAGFDHTEVFYHAPTKVYVVLTEPYSTSPCQATFTVSESLKQIPLSIIVCKRGVGLWNPPHCIPVVIGRRENGAALVEFAKALPDYTGEPA